MSPSLPWPSEYVSEPANSGHKPVIIQGLSKKTRNLVMSNCCAQGFFQLTDLLSKWYTLDLEVESDNSVLRERLSEGPKAASPPQKNVNSNDFDLLFVVYPQTMCEREIKRSQCDLKLLYSQNTFPGSPCTEITQRRLRTAESPWPAPVHLQRKNHTS